LAGLFPAQSRYYGANIGNACATYAADVNNTLSNGAKAYCQAVWARHSIALHNEILKRRKQSFEATYAKYEKKIASKLEVLREQSSIADVEAQILNYQAYYELYSASLFSFLDGRSVDVPDRLDEIVLSPDADAAIRHPALVQIDYQYEQAKAMGKISAAQDYQYNLTLYQYLGASRASGYTDGEFYMQFSLAIPLLDGGKRGESVAQYKEQVRQIENMMAAKNIELEADKTSGLKQWRIKKEQVEKLEKEVEYAEESASIAMELYNKGFASQTDMLDAMDSVQNATSSYMNAVLDMHNAAIDLLTANAAFVERYLLPVSNEKPWLRRAIRVENEPQP
jgi:outer membrane protein TolC